MNNIYDFLKQKYGTWKSEKKYSYNGVLSKYSDTSYLNVLFVNPEYKNNIAFLKSNGIIIPKEIDEFYRKYNGIALFSQSFVVFGYITSIDMGYTPLGMQRMNMMIRLKNRAWDDSYVSIGEYANFDFCLKKKDQSGTIFVIDRKTCHIKRTFNSFSELLEYSVVELSKLYDKDGYKLDRPASSDSWLDNISLENIY